jgi:imidazolonepropionase-like amidohydrolase
MTRGVSALGPVTLTDGVALVGPRLEALQFRTLTMIGGGIVRFDGPVEGTEVPLDGAWVCPGLVDAHVHLDLVAAPRPFAQWDADPVERSRGLLVNGLAALAAGTLAVRDLGCVDHTVLDYGRLTATGRVLGPAVRAAGRFLAIRGGHLSRYARVVDGAEDVREAVREQVAAGAGVIKVMATGGLTTPGQPGDTELTDDELVAAVDEARRAGLTVAAHAHGREGVRRAVEAGVASIEHGALIGADEVDLLRAHDVTLVPTLTTVLRLRADCGVDADVWAKTEAIRPEFMANIARALTSSVRIAAGTDAGCAHNPVGYVADELDQYVALGMSAYDALLAGTVNGGRLLGLPGSGALVPGNPADLIVLGGDPREDLAPLHVPLHVIRAGKVLDPARIEAAIEAFGGRVPALPAADAAALSEQVTSKEVRP